MPLGIGSFHLFAQGPRSDLEVAYLNATINGATVTVNATETSPGFNVFRTATGAYTVVFPPCRYCKIIPVFCPNVGTNGRGIRVLAGFDPTLKVTPAVLANGIGANALLEICVDGTQNGAAGDPPATSNELELFFVLGF